MERAGLVGGDAALGGGDEVDEFGDEGVVADLVADALQGDGVGQL